MHTRSTVGCRAEPSAGTNVEKGQFPLRLDENKLYVTTIRLRLSGEDPMWVFTTSSGKPGAVTNYFPEPLGLDGRFRVAAPNRFGIAAARGRWASDISFEIERRILGGSVTQHSILTFEGNNVTVHFVDTDGRKRIYTDAPNERRSSASRS